MNIESIVRYIGDSPTRKGKLATIVDINGDIAYLSFLDNSLNVGSWSCRLSSVEIVDKAEIKFPFDQYTSEQLAKIILDEFLDGSHVNHHSYNKNYDSSVDIVLGELFTFWRKQVQELLEAVIENNRKDVTNLNNFIQNVCTDFQKSFRQTDVIASLRKRHGDSLSIDMMVWNLLSSRHQKFFKLIRNVFEDTESYWLSD